MQEVVGSTPIFSTFKGKIKKEKWSGGGEFYADVPEAGWPRIPLRLHSKIIERMSTNIEAGKDFWGIRGLKFGINLDVYLMQPGLDGAGVAVRHVGNITSPFINSLRK